MDAQIQDPEDYAQGRLVDLFPGFWLDVPLYWQHWLREPPQAARLTKAILAAAKRALPTLETSPDSSGLPRAI
jgi:LysR family transcriptional regulator (chromosome initiation inhibitor)